MGEVGIEAQMRRDTAADRACTEIERVLTEACNLKVREMGFPPSFDVAVRFETKGAP